MCKLPLFAVFPHDVAEGPGGVTGGFCAPEEMDAAVATARVARSLFVFISVVMLIIYVDDVSYRK